MSKIIKKSTEPNPTVTYIIPLHPDIKDVKSFLGNLSNVTSKNSGNNEFIVLCEKSKNNDNKEFADAIEKVKSLAEVQLVISETKKETAKIFSEVLNKTKNENVIIVHPSQINHTGILSNWTGNISKHELAENIVVPDASGKKSKGIKGIISGFFRKLLASFDVKNIDNGIIFGKTSTFQKFSNQFSGKIKDIFIELLYLASVNKIKVQEYALNTELKGDSRIGSRKIIKNAICNRWQWYVKIPIRETFCKTYKSELSIWNSNHAIYRLLFFGLTILTLFLLPALSFDYNVTWDEPEDQKYFEKVLNYFVTFGSDKSCLDMSVNIHKHLIYYGPFVNLLCAFIYKYLSPFGLYETRHIIIALFGFLAILFTALTAQRIAGWRNAVIAFLFILLTPFFFGSSMNNQKDIPFAAFNIISFYFILRLMEQLPNPRFRTIFMLIIAIGITMSIRVAGLLMFAYLGLFMGLYWIWYFRKEGAKAATKLFGKFLKLGIVIFLFAYLIGIAFWPYAIQNPITGPFTALSQFEQFSLVHIWEIFEGAKYYIKEFPWHYIPKSILITTPLFVLSGLAFVVLGYHWITKSVKKSHLWMLIFITIFPVVYIIYKQSPVYSSWRHVYFIFPSMVVLASLGWSWILDLFKHKIIRIAIVVVFAALLIKPTFWMIKNHPYQYVYYNELIGGVAGAYGYYETDYWCQSPREAIEWLIKKENLGSKKVIVATNNEITSVIYPAKKFTDSIGVAWVRPQEWYQKKWDYAIFTTRTLPKKVMLEKNFPPKGTIHTIEVDGIPLAAIIKRENFDIAIGNKMIDAKNIDSATKCFINAVQYNPNEEEAYRGLGLVYLMKGELDKCEYNFKKAIELYPENAVAHYFLGLAYMRRSDLPKAESNLKLAIKYKVNLSQAHSSLGDIYLQQQRYRDALRCYEKFLLYRGQTGFIYNQIGKAFIGLQNYDKAIENFSIAVKLEPNLAEAYHNMGYAYSMKGDNANAQRYINHAKKLMGQ